MNHCIKALLAGVIRAAAVTGLMALPLQARAACKVSSLELPVTMVDSRAVATLGINGTQVRMMVDSGAFFSTLTHGTAQQLNLRVGPLPWGMTIEGLTGRIESGLTSVKRLQLLGGEVPDVEFLVGGNDEDSGVMGLLGRNLLAWADTEYDLAHGVIRLMVPTDCDNAGMAYWADGKPVSVLPLLRDDRSKTPAIKAIAEINGKKVKVLFDTGAQSLVSLRMAKAAGITDMKPAGKVWGGGSGEAAAWTASVERFEIGGEAISNIRMRIADLDRDEQDMLLGIDFFLSHRIYVSKRQRRMYFTYNGGPVFALSALEMAKANAKAPPPAAAPSGAAGEAQAANLDQPTDAAGFAGRGAASAARLDFAAALADLNRACEMAPQVAAYFVRRGRVHEALHQGDLALKDYETALQLDPAETEARLRRAWFRAGKLDREGTLEDLQALDKTLAPQANQRLQVAQLYGKFELKARALPQWNLWVASHPHDMQMAEVLNERCWARMTLNIELDKALADCDDAIDLQSRQGSYYDSRGWVRLRRAEFSKAVSDFDRSLKLRPESAWSLYGRGIARGKLGDATAGQADIEAARRLKPSIDAEAGAYGLAAELKPGQTPGAVSAGS